MNKEEEAKLRKEIAEEVSVKMCYFNTCLNERDSILSIILDESICINDRIDHCNTDCVETECKCHRLFKGE